MNLVVRWQAVIRVARHRRGFAEQEGDAEIGNIVFLLVEVGEGEARVLADPGAEGRRHAETLIAHEGAAFDIRAVAHQRDAKRTRVAGRDIDVSGAADLAVRAAGQREIVDGVKLWFLGDLVDDTPGRASPEQGGSRAFVDFHGVVIEGVAGVEAGVALAVEEEIVAGGKAAQIDGVAMGTAFARVSR